MHYTSGNESEGFRTAAVAPAVANMHRTTNLFLWEKLWTARCWPNAIILIKQVSFSHDSQSVAPVRTVCGAGGTTHIAQGRNVNALRNQRTDTALKRGRWRRQHGRGRKQNGARQHVPSYLVVPTSTPGDEAISHGPILVSSTGIVSAETKSSGNDRLLRLESLGSIVDFFHKRRIARGMSSSCQPLSCKALTTSHRIAKLSSTGCMPWEAWRSSPSAADFSSCGYIQNLIFKIGQTRTHLQFWSEKNK